jgi:hypothetical protein
VAKVESRLMVRFQTRRRERKEGFREWFVLVDVLDGADH